VTGERIEVLFGKGAVGVQKWGLELNDTSAVGTPWGQLGVVVKIQVSKVI